MVVHVYLERIDLETRVFVCHAIHVLCNANTLVILLVLLQIKNKFVLVFIITLLQNYFACK
jgi:hypothetical protein